ncbi:hypothetical protein LJ753_16910 [Arthrobacter sp. zg-Y20]|uniref:hypothetical protein n=1 Tax=unclassified Arthrobacter TaxID=235627 RepID=UPI001D157E08|nr:MULTISPECIES: hypothetical protein [unclassified Arthrobacter]MCC3277547.1 hypothetical protein [Arthrobacter sp. zg-Y20]MDK1317706.1 hypothetical protein [Arthrobacter sp. zg.Y20]WIB07035.1 hypothetical protein QNO06_04725 [Arthrobacter sp. zg-Y20]
MSVNPLEQFVSDPKLAEAMSNLHAVATKAAEAGRKFSQDYEAAQRRQHLERLERQRRWEQMRATN